MPNISRAAVAREGRRIRQFSKFRLLQLNLIPLVDVFVALVFFTLLTMSQSTIPVARGVQLPESVVGAEPAERITLGIGSNPAQVTLDGETIMTVQQAAMSRSNDPRQPLLIPELHAVLRQKADSIRRVSGTPADQSIEAQLAIHGDRTMRYDLLSRVMQTARLAGFRNLTLQVLRGSEDATIAQAE